MKRRLSRNVRGRSHDHWLSLLPDLCERTLQSLLPELREYAMNLLLQDIEHMRTQYCEDGYPTISRHSLSNIQRLERMGMAGCKLAIAANSSKIDFESLGELLVELLPFLWSAVLQDTALDILRTEFEDRFGEKIEEVQQIMEEIPSSDSTSSSPRSQSNTSLTSNFSRLRERGLRIPTKWGATRVASWCH